MGSRERKRAERRKRKRRNVERADTDAAAEPEAVAGNGRSPADLASRAEAKNRAAREALEPLGEGERPLVVTLGAIVAALISLSVVIAYAAGAEVDGERPNFAQVAAPAVLMGITAWGMWKARYWAVLGFQTVLLFVILWSAISLVGATDPFRAIGNFLLIGLAGTGFWFMVKALARIQMPDRRPPR